MYKFISRQPYKYHSFYKHDDDFKKLYGEVIYYSMGREAIASWLDAININAGDNVLLPSYLCPSAVLPFLDKCMNVSYYELNHRLSPNIDDMRKKINPSTRVIMVVHYYGFPFPMEEISSLINNKNIYVLEDCAHALFGKKGTKKLGDFFDASIFSLPKILPVLDGGILKINSKINCNLLLSTPEKKNIKMLVYNFVNKLMLIFEIAVHIQVRAFIREYIISGANKSKNTRCLIKNEGEERMYFKTYKKGSKHSLKLYFGAQEEAIVKIRRRNYKIMAKELASSDKIKLLTPEKLEEGVSPMCLVILVPDRDKVRKKLLNYGIDARPIWYQLPPGAKDSDYPESARIAKDNLVLPVHQDLKITDIEYVLKVLKIAI